jgi:hypothetical protein
VSNSYSIGVGDTNFEHEVRTLYLAPLLTEDIPAGVQAGKVEKVQFQTLYAGTLVDDIVIALNDDNRQRIICYPRSSIG